MLFNLTFISLHKLENHLRIRANTVVIGNDGGRDGDLGDYNVFIGKHYSMAFQFNWWEVTLGYVAYGFNFRTF